MTGREFKILGVVMVLAAFGAVAVMLWAQTGPHGGIDVAATATAQP